MSNFIGEIVDFPLGKLFPEIIQLHLDDLGTDFSWIKKNGRGSMIFFYGDFCSTCNTQIIEDISTRGYEINIIFFNVTYSNALTTPHKFNKISSLGVSVYSINLEFLVSALGISMVPSVITIDSYGRIISGSIISNSRKVEKMAKKILKIL
ncbi:hypothetical protein [Fontibacillus sp. BL9]|uniref:hypothetical protein n=1 Tax=Fontibacillus sp. BL9 TaxID=3389971 RepID=UPI00397C8A0E